MHAIVRWFAGFAGLTLLFFAAVGCAPSEGSSSSTNSSEGETASQSEDGEVARALAVEAVELSRGPFIDPVRTSGTIAGTREALIVSETQGIMQEVNFSLGDTVEAGEVLVSLDSSIQGLNREQAAAQFRSAQLELETTRRLVEQGSASEVQLRRTEAAARGAEAAYEQAKKAFDDRTIEAPFSGRVRQLLSGGGADCSDY
jgi:membrane fusion protein (multidrug efflux system)